MSWFYLHRVWGYVKKRGGNSMTHRIRGKDGSSTYLLGLARILRALSALQ